MDEDGIRKARSAFNTGLDKVDELQDKRTTWTMRGWRETLKDGTQVMRAERITTKDLEAEKAETAEKQQKRAAAAEVKEDEGFEEEDKENEDGNKENEEKKDDKVEQDKEKPDKEKPEEEKKTYNNVSYLIRIHVTFLNRKPIPPLFFENPPPQLSGM